MTCGAKPHSYLRRRNKECPYAHLEGKHIIEPLTGVGDRGYASSVDIDLNYIGAPDRETMLAERPKVEQAIAAVYGRQDFAIPRIPEGPCRWQVAASV